MNLIKRGEFEKLIGSLVAYRDIVDRNAVTVGDVVEVRKDDYRLLLGSVDDLSDFPFS